MAKADVTVLLVQSGPSSWDAEGRLEGQSDLPLTDDALEGLRNAIARRTREGKLLPDLVLYWGEHGSKQIALAVSGQAACKAKASDGLAPVSLGLWEGTLEEELLERTPKSFKRWKLDPTSVTAPEGESTEDFEDRFCAALARVADKHQGKVIAMVLRPMEYRVASAALGYNADGQSTLLYEATINAERVRTMRSNEKVKL